MAAGIKLRAFARLMGVTIKAVQKARDSKRIRLNADGTIDPVAGKRAWRENTLHTKRHRSEAQAPTRHRAPRVEPAEPAEEVGSMSAEWHRARAVRESIQARLLQLELERQQGKTIDTEEVRKHCVNVSREIKDLLQGVPRRLGPEVSGLTPADATRVLQEEMDRICDRLAEPAPSTNGHK